jgi:hypothetical protein
MATDITAVRVGLTGAYSIGPTGTAAPTDATTAINVAYVDSGAISEDGITLTLPGSGDKTTIKMWQNGAQVRTLRTASEDVPQLSFTFLETNKTAVETYFGATVTQTLTHGTFDYTVDTPTAFAGVLDVLDGAIIHRFHTPRVVQAEVGDLVYKNNEAIGYNVTLDLELDTTSGYNFRAWMTDLAS